MPEVARLLKDLVAQCRSIDGLDWGNSDSGDAESVATRRCIRSGRKQVVEGLSFVPGPALPTSKRSEDLPSALRVHGKSAGRHVTVSLGVTMSLIVAVSSQLGHPRSPNRYPMAKLEQSWALVFPQLTFARSRMMPSSFQVARSVEENA